MLWLYEFSNFRAHILHFMPGPQIPGDGMYIHMYLQYRKASRKEPIFVLALCIQGNYLKIYILL